MVPVIGASPLAELQVRFQAHVLQDDAEGLSPALADVQAHVPGDAQATATPSQRLGVYHHAYRARLRDTLRDTHAQTLAYLGDAWFDHLATAFIAAQPSTSANLRWYGQSFAHWLTPHVLGDDAALGHHPELVELATLDHALREAFDGPNAALLTAADLATLPAQAWSTLTLLPHPTVRALRVQHNTLALWTALSQDAEVPPAQALPEPTTVLVWRMGEQPHFRSLDPAEAQAIDGVLAGHSWADICAGAPGDDPGTQATVAAQWLRRWLQEGLLRAL